MKFLYLHYIQLDIQCFLYLYNVSVYLLSSFIQKLLIFHLLSVLCYRCEVIVLSVCVCNNNYLLYNTLLWHYDFMTDQFYAYVPYYFFNWIANILFFKTIKKQTPFIKKIIQCLLNLHFYCYSLYRTSSVE